MLGLARGLLTGCYPNRIGIHGALAPRTKVGISSSEMTLAELLKQRGYATAIFGKWHLGDARSSCRCGTASTNTSACPTRTICGRCIPISSNCRPRRAIKRGYPDLLMFDGNKIVIPEVTHDDQNQLTTWYTERAVNFIEQNKERPFFLYLAHNMPHVPLHVSDKFRGKTERGLYGDVIEEIDWSVGQMLDALKRNGLEENTWVIFTSDNGPWLSYGNHAGSANPLREGKGTNWEGGTREPCVMRWPGHIPAGTECDEMLMTIDLFPTIAKLVGADLPEHKIDGLDVWPIISGKPGAKNPHDAYWFYYEVNQLQAVTSGDGRWKLQLPHTYRTLGGHPGGHGGLPAPYEQRKIEQAELYDLVNDIAEATTSPRSTRHRAAARSRSRKGARGIGDALTQVKGRGVREPGRVLPSKLTGLNALLPGGWVVEDECEVIYEQSSQTVPAGEVARLIHSIRGLMSFSTPTSLRSTASRPALSTRQLSATKSASRRTLRST